MADALSQAKAVLHHAEGFDKGVSKQSGHELSNTPYSLAKKAAPVTKPDSDPGKEAESIKTGLAWKAQQIKSILDNK